MNALLQKPAELKLLCDVAKPFTAVVAYDDPLARRNAIRFYSWLVQEFGDELNFDSGWWSFEQLSQSRIAKKAAGVTMGADMVVISTASQDLPGHAKLWIEAWLAGKGEQDMALVALVGAANSRKRPATMAHAYLELVAQQAGLSYFANQFQLPEPMSASTIEAIQLRAETVTPLLKEILHSRPSPHWGINE